MDVGAVSGPSNSSVEPTEVRMATAADRQPLLDLMILLHGENGLFSVSPAKVDAMLDRFYRGQGALIGVIGEVGAPVGAIYLEISQVVYSDDWLLVEQFNFVHPDHRRSSYAKQLIAYAKRCSDELKLPLMVGILSNIRTQAKMVLYDKWLTRAGGYYIYGLEHADGAPRWEA